MFVAVAAAGSGRHTKMRRRLGESPGSVDVVGPLMTALTSAGLVPLARIRGLSVSSSRAWFRSMNVMPTSLTPAFTGMRNSSGSSARGCRHAPAPAPPTVVMCAPLAVDGDLELVRLAARARDVELDVVVAVDGKVLRTAMPPRVPNGSSSTRASCQCSGDSRWMLTIGGIRGSPTARRLIFRAASR